MSRTVTGLSWLGPATLAISVHAAVAFMPVGFGSTEESAPPPVKLSIEPPPDVEPPPEPSEPAPEPPAEISRPPERASKPPPAPAAKPTPEPEPASEPPPELGIDSAALAKSPTMTSSLPALDRQVAAPPPPPAPPAQTADLSGYRNGLHRALTDERRYPMRARRLELEGRAQVQIAVRRDGSLGAEPELVRSTGHDVLDREVLRLARAAAPLSPLPKDYPDEEAEFLIPVVFELDR